MKKGDAPVTLSLFSQPLLQRRARSRPSNRLCVGAYATRCENLAISCDYDFCVIGIHELLRIQDRFL